MAVETCPALKPMDATNDKNGHDEQSAIVEGRTLELRFGVVGGPKCAWTRLVNCKSTDEIWIDVSHDGGTSFSSCGKRSCAKDRTYTDAVERGNKVSVRACAKVGNTIYRTAWRS